MTSITSAFGDIIIRLLNLNLIPDPRLQTACETASTVPSVEDPPRLTFSLLRIQGYQEFPPLSLEWVRVLFRIPRPLPGILPL